MNITPELKQKIRSVNLYDYIVKNYGVRFISKTENTMTGLCPHPDHDDSKPSFTITKNKDGTWGWWCHACHCGKKDSKNNLGSDIIAFEIWMSNHKKSNNVLNFPQACVMIMQKAGISYSYNESDLTLESNKKIANAFYDNLIEQENSEAYKFLINRNLDKKDIEDWTLGYDGNRIVIPLFDRYNQVRGFTRRQLRDDGRGKYINSSNSQVFCKSKYLYGLNKIDINLDYVILTEGQFDVIMSYKYGLKNVLAVSGSNLTDGHMEIIESLKNVKRVILAFDNDEAGIKATKKASEILYSKNFMVQYLELPEKMDLCDFAVEHKEALVQTVFDNIVPYFYIEFKNDSIDFSRSLLNLKTKYISKIYSYVSKIKNEDEKNMFKSYVKNTFDVEIENV
jgi:DNA primase